MLPGIVSAANPAVDGFLSLSLKPNSDLHERYSPVRSFSRFRCGDEAP